MAEGEWESAAHILERAAWVAERAALVARADELDAERQRLVQRVEYEMTERERAERRVALLEGLLRKIASADEYEANEADAVMWIAEARAALADAGGRRG